MSYYIMNEKPFESLEITFAKPAGKPALTARTGRYQWSCDVDEKGAGQAWSFTGAHDAHNAVRIGFENCPRLLAWSAEQLLVPKELLSV